MAEENLPVVKEAAGKTFDDVFNRDEKEVNKAKIYRQKKSGKKAQLLSKITDLKLRLDKLEGDYTDSLIDPNVDTIELAIDIKVAKEELQLAFDVADQLFPKEFSMDAIKGEDGK